MLYTEVRLEQLKVSKEIFIPLNYNGATKENLQHGSAVMKSVLKVPIYCGVQKIRSLHMYFELPTKDSKITLGSCFWPKKTGPGALYLEEKEIF